MAGNWKINGAILCASALAWAGTFLLNDHFLHFFKHTPGIDFIFMPSGGRFLLIIIGGIWAALGVCLGSLFLVGQEFGVGQPLIILIIAAGTGLFPYAALRASLWAAGVNKTLANLSAIMLPLISLGVAMGSAVLHNVLFSVLGIKPWQDIAENTLAMAAGDFTGTLLAIVLVFAILRLIRRSSA